MLSRARRDRCHRHCILNSCTGGLPVIRTAHLTGEFDDVLSGIRSFIDQEVLPRHRNNEDLFTDPRKTYDQNGRYAEEILALMREVRMASANAGYYNMFVPEDLGGEGLGLTELFLTYEAIFHHAGPHHWLA